MLLEHLSRLSEVCEAFKNGIKMAGLFSGRNRCPVKIGECLRKISQAVRKSMSLHHARTDTKKNALGELLRKHDDARVLVFTSDNESAYQIARQHLIMPITCEIGRKERDQALDQFSTGKLRALVSARVLNEGLDVPDIGVDTNGNIALRDAFEQVDRSDAAFGDAMDACSDLHAGAGFGGGPGAGRDSTECRDALVELSDCVRDAGFDGMWTSSRPDRRDLALV